MEEELIQIRFVFGGWSEHAICVGWLGDKSINKEVSSIRANEKRRRICGGGGGGVIGGRRMVVLAGGMGALRVESPSNSHNLPILLHHPPLPLSKPAAFNFNFNLFFFFFFLLLLFFLFRNFNFNFNMHI